MPNSLAYRELLFKAPGIETNISGVVMDEETVDQATTDGQNFVELLRSRNIHVGIKIDKGIVDIEGRHN